ncbi:hypothetical protein GYMLUDRAFT_415104 [Collybiopsis luxurians FD-317 M1]|nr:hypothetical protein GYMLUDRAFT_415104 [Collybiopsis luxurians FD-317 M1]
MSWWKEWQMGTALYYAAEYGLTKRVEDILREKRRGHYENNGFQSDELLYINSKGGRWGNALQAAVQQNHKLINGLHHEISSEHLIAQGSQYTNAHQVHLDDSNKAVVQLLLENGADVNAQGGFYGNALQAAENEAVVKLLLEYGADVNAQGGFYGNVLQAAAERGNEAVVKLLLENVQM